ncbi:hypothetical protein F5883DRAFT_679410, partial [Diaporthe sp. PMI_573]
RFNKISRDGQTPTSPHVSGPALRGAQVHLRTGGPQPVLSHRPPRARAPIQQPATGLRVQRPVLAGHAPRRPLVHPPGRRRGGPHVRVPAAAARAAACEPPRGRRGPRRPPAHQPLCRACLRRPPRDAGPAGRPYPRDSPGPHDAPRRAPQLLALPLGPRRDQHAPDTLALPPLPPLRGACPRGRPRLVALVLRGQV